MDRCLNQTITKLNQAYASLNSEDLLAAIFVETDDLFQSFQRRALQHPFTRPVLSRSRKPQLSPAEVAIIVTLIT
jgi:hypothetical protein